MVASKPSSSSFLSSLCWRLLRASGAARSTDRLLGGGGLGVIIVILRSWSCSASFELPSPAPKPQRPVFCADAEPSGASDATSSVITLKPASRHGRTKSRSRRCGWRSARVANHMRRYAGRCGGHRRVISGPPIISLEPST